MSSKTINVNPDFLKGDNNKTQKKKKKVKPTKQIRPNTLKKELLERIKNHKKKSDEKIQENAIVEKNDNTSKSVESTDKFNNDFTDSLNYLSSIKKEKKQNRINNKMRNKTLKNFNKPSVPPNVVIHTGLPPILNTISDPTAGSFTSEPVIMLNPQPPVAQNISPPVSPKNTSFESTSSSPKSDPESPEVNRFKSSERKPPPFGVLKRGINPTYRNWRKTMKKEPEINISISGGEDPFDEKPLTYREKRLQEIKNKVPKIEKPKPVTKMSKKRVRTIKKQYKLGKGGRTVSVLIKNLQTRKNIQKEKENLSHVSIPDMKKYLKKRNLLKPGSNAPNDVIRETFIGANTAGDIENMNGENLVDNYMDKS